MLKPLGARITDDKPWADKFPLLLESTVAKAERVLGFARAWREYYDQGREGACVGFSLSEMMTYLNRRRFDARWLWNQGKLRDSFADTNPGDNNGTTVDAAVSVLRDLGHVYVKRGVAQEPDIKWGVKENRWATTVDDIRTSIQNGVPVVMGTNWYPDFDNPYQKDNGEWFCGQPGFEKVSPRGGHAYMFNAVSDRRQAFRTPNNWGADQPQVWFPYDAVAKLLDMNGESTLVTDR